MTTIRIPTPLRPYTEGQKEVTVHGETIGGALKDLSARFPSIATHLYDESGQLRPYVNVFINQEDSRNMNGADTPVSEGDQLMIIPSIAGG
jgi:molybdopterin synthase sulfur carrier subunit